MSHEQPEPAGPISLSGDTPRRDAMRTMGAAGAALLGVAGLRTAAAAEVGADAKRHRRKRGKQGPAGPTGPAGPVSVAGLVVNRRPGAPFNVAENATNSGEVGCEAGELLLGGGYADGPTAPNCFITELDITNDDTWKMTVACAFMNTATDVTPIAFSLAIES